MDSAPQTPPGWYHAAGDPPGTQRYWDGSQWQGGPQPVAGSSGYGVVDAGGRQKADLGPRFVAGLIDWGILIVGYFALFLLAAIGSTAGDAASGILFSIGVLGLLGFVIWNHIIRQGSTGQTIGKSQQGLTLLGLDGNPIGGGKAFVRYFVGGIIDNVCLINTLWIFFDSNNQRLADKIIDANVYRV